MGFAGRHAAEGLPEMFELLLGNLVEVEAARGKKS